MPFDKEFQHHLHEVMVAASLQVRDEVEQRKRELIFKAQQTHNGAAMPVAYSDAAIYAFKTRTQRVIDGYFHALDDCGIPIDADVERELLKMIGSLTSAIHPLTFPPGLRGQQLSAVQRAHAQETMRVGNQLQREAANRLRAAKMKNDKTAKLSSQPSSTQERIGQTRTPSEPKAGQTFVSYAWESPEHKEWVLALATALRQSGVDVVLDEWHLPPGGDMYHFMEQSVRSAEFVVVVCTPAYAAKADARIGGVGYEARIITTELARQTDQRKFIPILRNGEFPSAAPIWLASRRGLDFTTTPYSAAEFERLLRTLHRDEIEAPALGPKPVYGTAAVSGVLRGVPSSAPQPSEQFGEQILASRKEFAQRNPLDNKTYDYFLETAFIPESFVNRRYEVGKLRQIAFEASVDFVGWPFLPIHWNRPDVLSVFEDGLQSFWYTDDYFGGKILDFWRLYESGLFYKKELPFGVFQQPEVAVYPIVAQYFALAVDCLARLYSPLLDLQETVTFRATITGTKGRRMVNGTQGLPLPANYTSQIPIIQVEQTHLLVEWKSAINDFAAGMMAEVQTRFNWIQRDSSLAKQIIDRILSRTF